MLSHFIVSITSYECNLDQYLTFWVISAASFVGNVAKSYLPHFGFSEIVSFGFAARENHLKFRAQLQHLRWIRVKPIEARTVNLDKEKRGFPRTSAFPACSKTSEFSASTECVRKNMLNFLCVGKCSGNKTCVKRSLRSGSVDSHCFSSASVAISRFTDLKWRLKMHMSAQPQKPTEKGATRRHDPFTINVLNLTEFKHQCGCKNTSEFGFRDKFWLLSKAWHLHFE